MSTYAVYFSPTRTNERNATAIAEVFCDVKHLNFTNPDKVQDVVMTKDDVAVFAAPVYGGRIFKVTLTNAKEWIAIATRYADNKVENIIKGTNDDIWWVSQPAVDETANTVTYTFVYKNESHTDELGKRIWTSTDSKDLVLFNEIAIPGGLTNDELAAVGSSKITVVAEAIQADGFETEAAAWAAFDAQK